MDHAGKAVKAVNLSGLMESPTQGRKTPKLDEEKLKKTCRDFEAIFIHKLLKDMRATVPQSGLLDGGSQQELYRSMFDEEFSKNLAAKGGVGLGKILYRNLSQPRPDLQGDSPGEKEWKPLPPRRQREE